VGAVTAAIASLPVPLARMQAVEILLADPEALGDDVLESALYLLRERLRAALWQRPRAGGSPVTVTARDGPRRVAVPPGRQAPGR